MVFFWVLKDMEDIQDKDRREKVSRGENVKGRNHKDNLVSNNVKLI